MNILKVGAGGLKEEANEAGNEPRGRGGTHAFYTAANSASAQLPAGRGHQGCAAHGLGGKSGVRCSTQQIQLERLDLG
eukprot:350218-Chlamydomonas_euryale.AAC.3